MEITALIHKMTVFVVLMVIGYVCARRGYTDASFTKTTSKLVVNIFMAATILKSVFAIRTDMGFRELSGALLMLSLTMLFCFLVGAVVTRLLRIDREHEAPFELLCSLGNTMFIGLPVAEAVLGPLGVFYVSVSNIPFNVLLYTYGVWRLKGGGRGAKLQLKSILTVPLITTLVGLLIFFLRPPIPTVVRELADTMSGATAPLSMLVIGTSLGGVKLLDAFKMPRLYLASLIRLLLAPVLVALLGRFVIADATLLTTCVIIAACPGAVLISVLCIQYGRDYVFASQGILQSTVLSAVTIPLILYLCI